MKQAIREFKAVHSAFVECEQKVRDLWGDYVNLGGENDKKTVKARKKIMKKRSAAIVQCGNLSQKKNIAEVRMIKAILAS